MAQEEYSNGFSTFEIEMVMEFDDRDYLDKLLRGSATLRHFF